MSSQSRVKFQVSENFFKLLILSRQFDVGKKIGQSALGNRPKQFRLGFVRTDPKRIWRREELPYGGGQH